MSQLSASHSQVLLSSLESVLWFKFGFGAFLNLVQFLLSFFMYSLPLKNEECLKIVGRVKKINDPYLPGDVIHRTGMKNFNAVSHNRPQPYFRIQHGRGKVRELVGSS